MKKLQFVVVMLLLSCSIFAQMEIPQQTDQVIVQFKKGIALKNLNLEKRRTGDSKVDQIILAGNVLRIKPLYTGAKSDYSAVVMKFANGTDLTKIIDELNSTEGVDYAEPDFIGQCGGVLGVKPNDQYYSRQWGLNNNGTFSGSPAIAGADIDMEEGWAIEQGDTTVVVGIIDSGCKLDHPEFQSRIWKNYKEIPGNGIDDDKNGFVDDNQGWDFANNDNNPTDDFGHGTNVAGIIGAKGNNGIGYAGVDWNCKLMILKGLDKNNWGYYSWWSDAIRYAVDNGANVLNLSLGGTDVSTTLQASVNYALNHNVTPVVCMMNANSNTTFYPAAYPGVVAVGSTNPNDKRSRPFFWSTTSGSNYGSHISVVAPGNYIYGLDHASNTNYGYYWGGTSQATPHVCGLVSLLLAQNPKMTPAQIKSLIERTAEDQVGDPAEDTKGWDQFYGFGRINARNALLLVSGVHDPAAKNENFFVYPNPSKGSMTLQLSKAPIGKNSLVIRNCLGQSVFTSEINEEKSTIEIATCPGIYFLTVKQGRVEQTQKIIVR